MDEQALKARAEGDAPNDRIPVALSSEHPVERTDWWTGDRFHEVLDHAADAVDLSRAADGLPFLVAHDSREMVGLIEDVRVDTDRVLRGEIRFSRSARAQEVRDDITDGIRKKISVGYVWDRNNIEISQAEDEALATHRIKRWTPLEGSTVPIPADPTVGIDREQPSAESAPDPAATRHEDGPEPEEDGSADRAHVGRAEPVAAPRAKETQMPKKGDGPQDGAEDRANTASIDTERDRSRTIVELCQDHRDLGFGDRAAEFIAQGTSADKIRELILEARKAANSPPTPPTPEEERKEIEAPSVHVGAARDIDKPGMAVGFAIRALVVNKGDPDRALAWARNLGAPDRYVRALAAGDAVAGGFLVAPEQSSEVIELLRPASVVRSLEPQIIPMETGTLEIPKITGGATAKYTGENKNVNKTEPATGMLKLVFHELGALVPVGNKLIQFAPGADQMVRDDLIASLATRSDLAFIRGDGSEYSPKGARYWAPAGNVIAANATINLDNVTTDLGKLVLALENADVRMLRPGWMFAPRTKHYLMTVRDGNGNFAFRDEMLRKELWGFPFGVTTQIPTNLGGGADESEVYLLDFADAVIGESTQITIDASPTAAYHDGTQVVAAFSQNQTVIRAIMDHDFGMRHDASVAVLTTVKWGA